jgi:uncharacterized membrane protein
VFFGTAAITIGAFIVGVAEKALRRCTSSCSDQEILRAIKYVVLAANAFAIFFNFSQATRFALHTQILMNTKGTWGAHAALDVCVRHAHAHSTTLEIRSVPLPASIPCRIFRRAHSHFAWGIRGFYLMIPLLAWVLTEYALAAVTVPYCLLVYYVEITDLRTASAAPRSEKNEQQEEEEQEAEHTTARVGAEVSSATL